MPKDGDHLTTHLTKNSVVVVVVVLPIRGLALELPPPRRHSAAEAERRPIAADDSLVESL